MVPVSRLRPVYDLWWWWRMCMVRNRRECDPYEFRAAYV